MSNESHEQTSKGKIHLTSKDFSQPLRSALNAAFFIFIGATSSHLLVSVLGWVAFEFGYEFLKVVDSKEEQEEA